ncbi:CD226 antigen isoform X2 [Hoplias malabaricus]|uniref:CD226 antigen isoform X2 n=1 Tax=Hoplias malabaricus TaxID=27720 RepID=UPI0034623C16
MLHSSHSEEMEAVQKENWYFLVLVISLAFLRGSEGLRAPVSKVQLQEDMVLDCVCPWSGKLSMVSWTKDPDIRPLAVYHPDYGVNFGPAYEGRVQFKKASQLDGSIVISNVTEDDLGLYHCSLQTFPHGSWTKDTLVQEKTAITTPSLHPLSEMVISEGQDVTLPCKYYNTTAVTGVSLEKLWSELEGSRVLAECKTLHGRVEVTDMTDRVRANCSEELEMIVRMDRLRNEDAGIYRCNFSTDTGVQYTTFRLHTIPSQEEGDPPEWLYSYVGAGVTGVLVLMSGVLLVTWLNRRKRRRREEYRIQLHPTKRRSWRSAREDSATRGETKP